MPDERPVDDERPVETAEALTMTEAEHERLLARAVALPPSERLADTPADWAMGLLMTRAGIPTRDPAHPDRPHPLRDGFVHTHASARGKDVPRIPAGFTWPDPRPETLGGALIALDDAAALPPAPADAPGANGAGANGAGAPDAPTSDAPTSDAPAPEPDAGPEAAAGPVP